MKVMQTRFGEGAGNCTEACYATLLRIPITEVPDLSQVPLSRRMWTLVEWLRTWELAPMRFPFTTPQEGLWIPEDTPYIVAGLSPRQCRHAVIYMNGELWHDPHPSGLGLVAPDHIWTLSVTRGKHAERSGEAPPAPD